MNFYLVVKKLCDDNGVKMADLEKALGVGHRTFYNWNTSMPSIDKVMKIADYFGMTVDQVIGINEPNQPEQDANLTADQKQILEMYNSLSLKNRVLLDEILERLLKSQEVQ